MVNIYVHHGSRQYGCAVCRTGSGDIRHTGGGRRPSRAWIPACAGMTAVWALGRDSAASIDAATLARYGLHSKTAGSRRWPVWRCRPAASWNEGRAMGTYDWMEL